MHQSQSSSYQLLPANGYYVRVGTWDSPTQYADLWLIQVDGAAESGVMHGTVCVSAIEALTTFLEGQGMLVERQHITGGIRDGKKLHQQRVEEQRYDWASTSTTRSSATSNCT
jgi:hypothetical protein